MVSSIRSPVIPLTQMQFELRRLLHPHNHLKKSTYLSLFKVAVTW
jgi:hypothetical protein